ncbi:MAG: DUF4249 domain-containing protein [Bacteroidetes bacterium]|nr:DUF4249 domain-containing protein [Bacteroidota bacterium]
MSFNFKIITLLITGFLLQGCETALDISNVTLRERIVINALLNNKDQVQISVSKSTSIDNKVKPGPLLGAEVTITDDSGNKITCTYNIISEKYEAAIVPIAGKTYSIFVRANGFPDASASLSIPNTAGTKSSMWKDSTSFDSSGFPQGTLTVYISDKKYENNYYRLTIYYYDNVTTEWNVLDPPTTDADIQSQALKTEDGGIVFSDRYFNGMNKEINFLTAFGYGNGTPKFLVVNESLGEEYYKFFKSLDDYKKSGGLFQEPNGVYSNIEHGLGIAAGSSIQRDTIH